LLFSWKLNANSFLYLVQKEFRTGKNCNSKIMPLYFFDSGLREVSGKIPVKFLKIRKVE
jgi:hypothetical protein